MRNQKGFSIIELAIVVIVVGAIYIFFKFTANKSLDLIADAAQKIQHQCDTEKQCPAEISTTLYPSGHTDKSTVNFEYTPILVNETISAYEISLQSALYKKFIARGGVGQSIKFWLSEDNGPEERIER